MKRIMMSTLLLCALISGCSTTIPGLTSHTNVPLELKGYRTGANLSSCPSGRQKSSLQGRKVVCVLDERSFGGTAVLNAGIVAFDGRIVSVIFKLDRAGAFSQPGVLRSLTEKFGPPARDASRAKSVFWSNSNDQLTVNEISGEVMLVNLLQLKALHDAEARAGQTDL